MVDFSRIHWAGEDCILITDRDNNNPRRPLLILNGSDIDRLNEEWMSVTR